MSALTSLANNISVTLATEVTEEEALVAICKNKAVCSAIAGGADVGKVLLENVKPLASIISASKSAPSVQRSVSTPMPDELLSEIAKMVRYMAQDFGVEELKKYIETHPDIKAGYADALSRGESQAKTYLLSKVPDIAMGYMTGT